MRKFISLILACVVCQAASAQEAKLLGYVVQNGVKTPIYAALTYAQGEAKSLATGKDLLTYVGIRSKKSDYAIVCEVNVLDGYPAKCIVLSQHKDGEHNWVATMNSDGKVIEGAKVVSRPASPFSLPVPPFPASRFSGDGLTADDEPKDSGSLSRE